MGRESRGTTFGDRAAGACDEAVVLAARLGFVVARVEEITTLAPAAGKRGAFRLSATDGRILKARRFESLERAEVNETIRARLPPEVPLSRPLAREGRWMLEEWVHGAPLDGTSTIESARWAGQLLGTLHRLPPPDTAHSGAPTTVDEVLERLRDRLGQLVDAGALSIPQADAVGRAASFHRPEGLVIGVTHGDLCPENVIRCPDGALVAVDQELVDAGSIDFDLHRLWYRWPMEGAARDALHQAYASFREPRPFFEHFVFFRLWALTISAWMRVTMASPRAEIPLSALREVSKQARATDRTRSPGVPLALSPPAVEEIRDDGLLLRVSCSHPDPLVWLREFVIPSPGEASEPTERCIEVDVRLGDDVPERAATGEDIACFMLDGRFERLSALEVTPSRVVARDTECGVVLEVTPTGVRLRARRDSRRLRTVLLRTVRELATRHSLGRGRLLLHASGVAVDGRSVVFCGQKGAGKTTLLLHASRQPGVSYVANDRVLLAPGEPPRALGVATLVSIRPDSLRFFPSLLERVGDRLDHAGATLGDRLERPYPPSLSIAQLCDWLAVPATRSAPVGLFLFPRAAPDGETTLRRVEGEALARRLFASLFPIERSPGRCAFDPLWPDGGARGDELESCRRMARRAPGYDCRLGPGAFAADGILWKEILCRLD